MNLTLQIFFFVLAFLMNLLCITLIAARYKHIFFVLGERISILHSIKLVGITQTVSYFTPFNLGIIIGRPFIAKKYFNIPSAKTLLTTIYDQWLELIWQTILVFILILITGSYFFNPSLILLLSLIATLVSVIFITYFKTILEKILLYKNRFPKIAKKFLKKIATGQDLSSIIESLHQRKMFSFRFLLNLFPLILLFVLIYPLILYFTTRILDITLTYSQSFLVSWISYLTGRLSGIPGGLGTRDLTLAALLTFFLPGLQDIVLLTLFYRILTFLPSFLIALPSLFQLLTHLKNYQEKPKPL